MTPADIREGLEFAAIMCVAGIGGIAVAWVVLDWMDGHKHKKEDD